MQPGQIILVRTDPATQFAGVIAQNALAELTIPMTPAGQTAQDGYVDGSLAGGRTVRSRLSSIVIASVEALDYTVWLFGDSEFGAAAPADTHLLGYVSLPSSGAKRIGGAGLYYYYASGLDIPYVDLERQGNIYLGLQPTSGGKSAGGAGAVMVQLAFQPTLGW